MLSDNDEYIINCKLGKSFVSGIVTMGYALIVLSILPVLTLKIIGFIVAVVLILIGGFLAFTTSGVDVDLKEKKLSNYLVYYGLFKTGNWVDIKNYNYVTVSMLNKITSFRARIKKTTNIGDKNYEVYLIDNPKANRQIIATFKHAKSAVAFAKKIAEKLEIKYINYHPEKGWE